MNMDDILYNNGPAVWLYNNYSLVDTEVCSQRFQYVVERYDPVPGIRYTTNTDTGHRRVDDCKLSRPRLLVVGRTVTDVID